MCGTREEYGEKKEGGKLAMEAPREETGGGEEGVQSVGLLPSKLGP